MIEALFFGKLFFITRNREYYRRIISKYNQKNYAKDENVSKQDYVKKIDVNLNK